MANRSALCFRLLLTGCLCWGGSAAFAGWFTNDQQDAAEALTQGDYDAALAGFADDYRRGVVQYRARRYEEAAESFAKVTREAVKLDATYNLGNARFQLGDFEGATQAYEAVLSQAPEHEDALHNLQLAMSYLEAPAS